MKTFLFVLFISSFAHPPEVRELPSNLNSISQAISNGDATALANHFDSTVELAILDDENMYSKAEAKGKVNAFFAKAKPKSYSQVHKGSSKGQDSQYCIGNLAPAGGNYRVYIYLKVKGAKSVIQEMRFDRN